MGLLEREYMKQRTDAEIELSDELPELEQSPESPKRVDPFSGMVSEEIPSGIQTPTTARTGERRIERTSISHACSLRAVSKPAAQLRNGGDGRLPNLNVSILIIVVLVGIVLVLLLR
jgi:hypothetical protein